MKIKIGCKRCFGPPQESAEVGRTRTVSTSADEGRASEAGVDAKSASTGCRSCREIMIKTNKDELTHDVKLKKKLLYYYLHEDLVPTYSKLMMRRRKKSQNNKKAAERKAAAALAEDETEEETEEVSQVVEPSGDCVEQAKQEETLPETGGEEEQEAAVEAVSEQEKPEIKEEEKKAEAEAEAEMTETRAVSVEVTSKEDENSRYRGKNVLVIGTGKLGRLAVLMGILNLPFKRVVCLSREYTWAKNFAHDWILAEHIDLHHKEATIDEIDKYTNDLGIGKFDAIITYTDRCTLMTSFLCEHYGLIGIPFDFCTKVRNKFEFRRLCQKLAVSCPRYFTIEAPKRAEYVERMRRRTKSSADVFSDGETAITDANVESVGGSVKCRLPVIVKNRSGASKDFVRMCKTSEELVQNVHESLALEKPIDLLVEEFYDGHEIDCEVLVQNNEVKLVLVSDNLAPEEPYFFEKGNVTPSIELSGDEKRAVERIIKKWISKMNFANGLLHFEARCRPESMYGKRNLNEQLEIIDENYFLMPIEINMRLGGRETWSGIKASCGIDLVRECLNVALGFKLDEQQLHHKAANPHHMCISSKGSYPDRNVIVEAASIDHDKLRELNDSIVELNVLKTVGDKLTIHDVIGLCCLRADIACADMVELNRKLADALTCIHLKFKDATDAPAAAAVIVDEQTTAKVEDQVVQDDGGAVELSIAALSIE